MMIAENNISGYKELKTVTKNVSLPYLFLSFLKVGSTSWGGFMSLISVIQKQMGDKDKTIEQETILQGISLASVLPGPMAVNVVTFIGYKLNGLRGALVSMAGILLPCFLLMLVLSQVYLSYGNVPAFNHFFAGILPAVAAIIVSVAFTMSKKSIKDIWQVSIAVLSAAAVIFSKSYLTTILIIVASGFAGYFIYHKKEGNEVAGTANHPDKNSWTQTIYIAVPFVFIAALFFIVPLFLSDDAADKLLLYKKITLTFSGISLTQFGGGYVVIPAMQKIIVDAMHWITAKEFTDAIAMGQVTPGPIFISATFIGYKLAGFWGALTATVSIFLPAGLLMIFCARFMERINKSAIIIAAFKGISPAIMGMVFSAAFTILRGSEHSVTLTLILFITVLIVVIKFKTNPVYLIPLAGIAGSLIF